MHNAVFYRFWLSRFALEEVSLDLFTAANTTV